MTGQRQRILRVSRLVSAAELEARCLPNSQGVLLGLEAAQRSLAKQLEKASR